MEIEKAAGYLFYSKHHYIKAKKKYLTAVKSGNTSKKHLLKLKEELKAAFYRQVVRTRIYKLLILYLILLIFSRYRSSYENLSEYVNIREKIDILQTYTIEQKHNCSQIILLVKEINELIQMIKNVKSEEKSNIINKRNSTFEDIQSINHSIK